MNAYCTTPDYPFSDDFETAADALRPYTPKKMKKSVIEKTPMWNKLSFGIKWNIRDILRHKARSAMMLVGIVGCMVLLVDSLGMSDTMSAFMTSLDTDINNYVTKVNMSETATNGDILSFGVCVLVMGLSTFIKKLC